MITKRDFMKRIVFTGAAVLLAVQIIRPLSAIAETGTENKADSGINYFLDSLHGLIKDNPYEDSRCMDLIKLADLYVGYGRRQDGLDALSESVEAAKVVKEHNRLEYASLLTDVADAYYNIGEEETSHDVILEAFEVFRHEFDYKYSMKAIISTVVMLDKVGEREKALQWLNETYSTYGEDSMVLMLLADTYLILGVDHRAKELAIEYSWRNDISPIISVRSLAVMAECLVEMGRIGEANDLIVVAMNMRNMLDKESQRRVADRLCIVYAKLGEWEKAFEIADDAKKEGCYFDMAKQAIMVGELDIARKAAYPAFTHLKLDTGRYIFKLSFPEVAELFREMGDTQQAVEILNRSLAYLEGSKIGGYWLGDELAGSAAVFIKMDEKAETLKLLRKAFESAIREGDTMLKIDLLLKIAEIYVENQIPAAEVFITAKAPDA